MHAVAKAFLQHRSENTTQSFSDWFLEVSELLTL
jgi:hypothetical protein